MNFKMNKEQVSFWLQEFNDCKVKNLYAEVDKLFAEIEWLELKDNVWYCKSKNFFVQFKDSYSSTDFSYEFLPFDGAFGTVRGEQGRCHTREESDAIIEKFKNTLKIMDIKYNNICLNSVTFTDGVLYRWRDFNLKKSPAMTFDGLSRKYSINLAVLTNKKSKLQILQDANNRTKLLEKLSNEALNTYHDILTLLQGKVIKLNDSKKSVLLCDLDGFNAIANRLKSEVAIMSNIDEILEKDNVRCGLTPYEKQMLFNSNGGNWELWETTMDTTEITVPCAEKFQDEVLYARNPIKDVNHNSVVSIDFGTKSTVAMVMDEQSIINPIRIGSGDLSSAGSNDKSYENPTVMKFIHIKDFLKAYKETNGRPLTKLNDLSVSWNAETAYRDSKNSEFKNYFTGLKQYVNANGNMLNYSDADKEVIKIKNYSELGESDIDPIEIYAYYIGLYINNMYRGIFINYMLSMPVTFEDSLRDRLKASFERGLKKSLPEAVLKDEEVMSKFQINTSCNESAAYAVTALTEFGLEPEDDDDKIFYGVFDFGAVLQTSTSAFGVTLTLKNVATTTL